MKKGAEFKWDSTCEKAFQLLRERLTSAPVLGIPRLDQGPFILTTDASFQAIAACLTQQQEGKEVTISFWSKTLNNAQRNYCITHLELLAVVEGIAAYDEFLAGSSFIVRTDHLALKWLSSFKNPKGRLARWIERLAAYNFVIEHVPGSSPQIQRVDALSRLPNRPCGAECQSCNNAEAKEQELTQILQIRWITARPADGLNPEQLVEDQRMDPNIRPILTALQASRKRPPFQDISSFGPKTRALWHQFPSLVIQDGLLKRAFEHPSGDPSKIRFQLVLPTKHVRATVQYYHSSLAGGQHFGRDKTHQLIKRYFYWPNMFEDIYQLTSECTVCFQAKGPAQRTRPPLKIFKDGLPHGRWHVDFCGPFVETPEGYRYILIAVESFSGWPVTIPMKSQTSLEVAEKLIERVFSEYGAPISLKSDRGRAFTSSVLTDVLTLYGVSRSTTTALHPKANGKVEVFVRTLKQHLRMLVQLHQRDWPKHLPFICQAYRALPVASTQYSPYEILFGAPMRLPIDMARGQPPNYPPFAHFKGKYNDYPLHLRQHLWKIHEEVRENIQRAARRMKNNYDRTSNYVPFKKGDEVWLFTPTRIKGRNPKLQRSWTGPWRILSILNDCVVRIQKQDKPNNIQCVNIDRIAQYCSLQ